MNLNYRTVRYQGHRDVMKLFLNDLRLGERRASWTSWRRRSHTMQDVVLVFVSVSGTRGGQLMRENPLRPQDLQQLLSTARCAARSRSPPRARCARRSTCSSPASCRSAVFVPRKTSASRDFIDNRFGSNFVTDGKELHLPRPAASGRFAETDALPQGGPRCERIMKSSLNSASTPPCWIGQPSGRLAHRRE